MHWYNDIGVAMSLIRSKCINVVRCKVQQTQKENSDSLTFSSLGHLADLCFWDCKEMQAEQIFVRMADYPRKN